MSWVGNPDWPQQIGPMMCLGCYQEHGSPAIVNNRTKEAARAVARVFERSPAGGNLHIVIDDWNLEDSSLDFCRNAILTTERDGGGDEESLAVQLECVELLRALSLEERVSALAIQRGFIS